LDIPTLDVLEESLLEFTGALVLVTHDRWLLDRVSTRLLALEGEGRAEWFADYAQWEAKQARKSVGGKRTPVGNSASCGTAKRKGLSYREQQEWDTIEQKILEAEEVVAACQAAATDRAIASSADMLQERDAGLHAAQAEVERLYARWAELEDKRSQVMSKAQS